MNTDYFPDTEEKMPAWFSNFAAKLDFFLPQIQLVDKPAILLGVQNDSQMVSYLINRYKSEFDASRTSVAAWANAMLRGGDAINGTPTQIKPFPAAPDYDGPMVAPNIVGRTRALVQRIKTAGGYTVLMGREMGIVATSSDHEMTAPLLKDIQELSDYRLRAGWLKGEADAIELQVNFGQGYPRRGQRLSRTPFTAEIEVPSGTTGPIAATIRAVYIEDDARTGEFGPEYPVNLRP